ncbi:MAG: oxidoreductase, partial [Caulobacter sp. 39-67-4]
MKTAFIGLGVMGYPMAGHLKAAGHEVSVFNRSPDKAQRWAAQHGGAAFETIEEA